LNSARIHSPRIATAKTDNVTFFKLVPTSQMMRSSDNQDHRLIHFGRSHG
jgi:hypothetical protein